MKVEVALQYAEALKRAAAQALREGRDELTSADLQTLADVDDQAREELAAAIQRAQR